MKEAGPIPEHEARTVEREAHELAAAVRAG